MQVSITNGTKKVEVEIAGKTPGGVMVKGDVFSFDGKQGHQMPVGDQAGIFFNAKSDPL